jgi:hypothetical protein
MKAKSFAFIFFITGFIAVRLYSAGAAILPERGKHLRLLRFNVQASQ